ncbi:glutamate 5-kinase [Pelobacter propionicus]|uniref:Glutamate 5-kinase n=1 Tax=Pelobacter propionicus (strain DSM 2379 / NBRC 103807 / OttBd1) TaxID=338966 RepID=PROB_PELPD|nr:glutamate 5-kinase [Pelobacter propionicus]A1AT80.1 RecName: Full=Glutamate 5-kinase; AltName: Full=Gamma-glutamyl kinase; Short=GK [Pelobacter propionicus DSM 2379]ABL00551.1 glutamate 5-kinase [Pelobacter propionicus DSM 2379]
MRRELFRKIKRVVVKIGSRVLTDDEGALDMGVIGRICGDIASLRRQGRQVVLVSSGAIAAGRSELGMTEKPRTIPHKQAAAAIGQTRMMRAYEESFAPHGLKVAQVLLTREDLASRQRFLNARATLDALLGFGVIPVINENDTVVVEEIKFGDNDNLSALVTNVAEAGLLVIMTDIEGFYSADPRSNPDAVLVPLVQGITREIERAAGGSGSSVGTGGMATKVAAAKKAAKNGVPTIIVPGKREGIIATLMAGQEVGTLFLPLDACLNRRKHWLAYSLKPAGRIIVDDGAREVLLKKGKSLLPSGVLRVEGRFERGACVRVCGSDEQEFARGLSDYSSSEIARLAGQRSSRIEAILGYRYGDVIIHRDNLVVL